jgi:hypothetical protein
MDERVSIDPPDRPGAGCLVVLVVAALFAALGYLIWRLK